MMPDWDDIVRRWNRNTEPEDTVAKLLEDSGLPTKRAFYLKMFRLRQALGEAKVIKRPQGRKPKSVEPEQVSSPEPEEYELTDEDKPF